MFLEPQESCRKGNGEEDQVPPVGWRKYFSYQINGYLQQMGIQREFSCRYTPEQNDVAERKNWSVVEPEWAMLEEKSMPKFYWAEAVRTAVYIQNQIGEKVSAHELYFRRKPNLRYLRVFGGITLSCLSTPDRCVSRVGTTEVLD